MTRGGGKGRILPAHALSSGKVTRSPAVRCRCGPACSHDVGGPRDASLSWLTRSSTRRRRFGRECLCLAKLAGEPVSAPGGVARSGVPRGWIALHVRIGRERCSCTSEASPPRAAGDGQNSFVGSILTAPPDRPSSPRPPQPARAGTRNRKTQDRQQASD